MRQMSHRNHTVPNMHVAVEQIISLIFFISVKNVLPKRERVRDKQGDDTITDADGFVTYIQHLPASHYKILQHCTVLCVDMQQR